MDTAATYSKTSAPILKADMHATIVEAAVKAFFKWRSGPRSRTESEQQLVKDIEAYLETWCGRVIVMTFEASIAILVDV